MQGVCTWLPTDVAAPAHNQAFFLTAGRRGTGLHVHHDSAFQEGNAAAFPDILG